MNQDQSEIINPFSDKSGITGISAIEKRSKQHKISNPPSLI